MQPSATPQPRALSLWVAESGDALAAVQAVVAAYTAKNDAAIQVVPKDADSLRLAVLGAGLFGELPPDLIWADQEALAGLLADGLLQPIGPAIVGGDLLPALATAATADGEIWGAPMTAQGALFLLYNRRLLASPPGTSDELIASTRAGGAGLVMGWDEPRWLLPWLYAFGGAPTSPDGTTPTLDTPAMLQALGLLRELYMAAPPDIDTYRRGQRGFGAGDVAIAVDGDWALAEYHSLTETLELGIAALPVVPATGRRAAPTLDGSFLLLGRDLNGPELARAHAFVAALSKPQTQADLAVALGRLPASLAAIHAADFSLDPALAAAASLANESPGLPPTKAARCALFGMDIWLPSLLSGRFDQVDTAAAMQREADACVTR